MPKSNFVVAKKGTITRRDEEIIYNQEKEREIVVYCSQRKLVYRHSKSYGAHLEGGIHKKMKEGCFEESS